MKFRYALRSASMGVTRHKSRSALTILGIVIGIASIILIQSVGDGAQSLILSQIQQFGTRTISIDPGRRPSGPSDFASLYSDSLGPEELDAILNPSNVPNLESATPLVFAPAAVTAGNEIFSANVAGAAPVAAEILNVEPEYGAMFTQEDVDSRASVVVLGSRVAEELFGTGEVIGERVKVKERTYRVVGVFEKKGEGGFVDVDGMVMAPYTTVQSYVAGIKHFNSMNAVAATDEAVPQVAADIEHTLRELHEIEDPDKDDFNVTTMEEAAEQISTVTDILTYLLSSIAAISLVVGGIGIMNIMLVSVTERTREIGLRKALGAKSSDVLLQFLIEAVMLTVAGGIIGITLGAGLSALAAVAVRTFAGLAWTFTFPFSAAAIGIAVAGAVGLIFGLYPASQAAKKSPMEALRYE